MRPMRLMQNAECRIESARPGAVSSPRGRLLLVSGAAVIFRPELSSAGLSRCYEDFQ